MSPDGTGVDAAAPPGAAVAVFLCRGGQAPDWSAELADKNTMGTISPIAENIP